MRLYLSKEEAYAIQYCLFNEIHTLSELPIYELTKSPIDEKMSVLNRIIGRIEMCLNLQKSGYNRKEK